MKLILPSFGDGVMVEIVKIVCMMPLAPALELRSI